MTPIRPARRPLWGRIAPLALLLATSIASAATHVNDNAGLFGAQATQQAEQQLADLQSRGGANVVVESFAEPPANFQSQIVNAPDAASRTRGFEQWMAQRAVATNCDVYVLINRSPGEVRITERQTLQSHGLPAAERDRLGSEMHAAFGRKDFDGGLTQAVGEIVQTLGNAPAPAHVTPTPAAAPNVVAMPAARTSDDRSTPIPLPGNGRSTSHGFGGLSCCSILGIGLLVVIVLAVVRRMGGNRGGPVNYGGGVPPVGGYPQGGYPPQGGYGYPPQAGGGFGRGVAGGLLGGVLGSVLGNQWSRGSSGQSGGGLFGGGGGGGGVFGGGATGGGGEAGGNPLGDAGFTSSSGGAFDAGPSDPGGGGLADSGFTGSSGGSFGGGDSGGGGGDSGSTGGDF